MMTRTLLGVDPCPTKKQSILINAKTKQNKTKNKICQFFEKKKKKAIF